MRTLSIVILGALALSAAAPSETSAAGQGIPMDAKAIKQDIAGKRIYLKVPMGGEFPLYYRKNGVVDGSGDAVGLGRFMAPNDTGKWWISGDQLCQQWSDWYDGKRYCFALSRTGETTLYWRRDDGLEGEARIGQ